MSTNSDVFGVSGPVHLSSIDWSSPHDQRVVLATLVQATYVLEKDREKRRVGPEALAPAWWQHFSFECREVLKDIHDSSIFRCIYEFKPPFLPDPFAPRFIVTFRGTLLDTKHAFKDGLLDMCVIFGGINKRTRLKAAVDAISKLISHCSSQNIWVGGHSLGASIATVAGKYMAKMDIHLKTFLFNPPFASLPFDWFLKLDSKLKEHLHICRSNFKGEISLFMPKNHNKSREKFSKLAPWIPYLFLNPEDPISASYISYFERRKKEKILGSIEQVATHTSLREIFGDVFGQGLEMPHLLPSASLAVNVKKLTSWRESHGIQQWWQHDISLECSDHYYELDTN